jgi:hypothetical protein
LLGRPSRRPSSQDWNCRLEANRAVPNGFLQPRTAYNWEVLAIERSGNQTLSSGSFRTR